MAAKAAKAAPPAAAKKPVATRGNAPGNSNPNTVLVVFLVLFVLISIGLGIWGYYGYEGQEELRKAAISKSAEAKAANMKADYFAFAEREMRTVIGDQLDGDETNEWELARQDFMKDDGKFKDEKTRPALLKFIQELAKSEITYDDANKKYSSTYKARIAKLSDDLKVAQGETAAKLKAWKLNNDSFLTLTKNHDAFYKDALAKIKTGNDAALDASSKRYKQMEDAFMLNKQLQDQLQKNEKTWGEEKEDLDRQITVLKSKLENKLREKGENIAGAAPDEPKPKPAPAVAAGGDAAEPHALLLDISTGKPLWDEPVGRIVRVLDARQAVINLGTADGVKPQLTFNVFAPGRGGKADKQLKGTVEVVRAVDAKSSVVNITSQNDDKDHPIKSDDLLFNVFFGTHVAIAGQVNWFAPGGARGESAEEQTRSLSQFMMLLQRQGVVVDGFVDLSSGNIKGSINTRTRYLIRGDNLYIPAKPAPKEGADKKAEPKADDKKDDKKDDGDKKEGAKEDGGKKEKDAGDAKPMLDDDALADLNAKRVQQVNESIRKLSGLATDNGCFIISAVNFANVAGYRKLLTTVAVDEPLFRPSLPAANISPLGPNRPGPGPAAPPKGAPAEKDKAP